METSLQEVVVETLDEFFSKSILCIGIVFQFFCIVVPKLWVQLCVLTLCFVLSLNVLVGEGVDQAQTLEVARCDEAHGIIGRLRIYIESILWNRHLRIMQ